MSDRIIPFRPRRSNAHRDRIVAERARRERIILYCSRAAVMAGRDDITDMWQRKARLAVHMPTADLTARPEAAIDFTPTGFDVRSHHSSSLPWFSIMVLIAMAMALTPMGWL